MGKNTLPPPSETYLSVQTDKQSQSALTSVYQNVMIDTAVSSYLTDMGIDFGVLRPPFLFSDDNLWRAVVKSLAFTKRHTRLGVASIFEMILGPQVSQATVLDRTSFTSVRAGDSVVIDATDVLGNPQANAGTYAIPLAASVLTHHIIFPPGTFVGGLPETNISYSVQNTISVQGNLLKLADGTEALVDTTTSFINTHPLDYVTSLNNYIPQYGYKIIFNKNSPALEEVFEYDFYDKDLSGILKLDPYKTPQKTHNKWMPIRSSVLLTDVKTGALSVSVSDSSNFPTNSVAVQSIQLSVDSVSVLPPGGPFTMGPSLINSSVSKNEIILDAAGPGPFFTVPTSPSVRVLYEITTGATGELSAGRGHFLSSEGRIVSTTRLVDNTVDFTKLLHPYITGGSNPFMVIINRGEANEELVEVASRAGTKLNLILDPEASLSTRSLLQFDHVKGETLEVYTGVTSVTGTYFPLTAGGDTVGTATAGSTNTALIAAAATFAEVNASATYGDELEIVSIPAGNANSVGSRRTISTYVSAIELGVTPQFPDTLLGCTFKIRKFYKVYDSTAPVNDNYLYLDDTTIFPAKDFSVVLDRGQAEEEVVWVDENNLTLNRLRIANCDLGVAGSPAPGVSKKHKFGLTVEPAQIFVPGCYWDIMETRATGEYTIATETACVPAPKVSDAWFLHERTPWWLSNSSDRGSEIGTVAGPSMTGGDTVQLPQASLVTPVAPGATSLTITVADFLRVFANKEELNSTKNPALVFRPALITSAGGATEEFFVKKVLNIGLLQTASLSGTDSLISDVNYLNGDVISVGNYNGVYLNNVELFTLAVDSTEILSGVHKGKYLVTLPSNLEFFHAGGESVLLDPVTVGVSFPITGTFAAASKINMLTMQPSYRYKDGSTLSTTFTVNATHPLNPQGIVCTDAKWFPGTVMGLEICLSVPGGAAPDGERRRITGVGGENNSYLFVAGSGPLEAGFSTSIPIGTTGQIYSFLQTGAFSDSRLVPEGDSNAALSAVLNTMNINRYKGGHKANFPGSYLYDDLNEAGTQSDQPTSTRSFLRTSPVKGPDEDAVYKFPGPRRLIAPPLVPYANKGKITGVNTLKCPVGLLPASFTPVLVDNDARLKDKPLQILGANGERRTSRGWRKIYKILSYDAATEEVTLFPNFSTYQVDYENINIEYRVLSTGPAATVSLGSASPDPIWVDYPEFFPDSVQNNFIVTLGRGTDYAEDVEIAYCVNTVGADYGKFQVVVAESLSFAHPPGTSVELKVTKIAVDSAAAGNLPSLAGGFYCEFGFRQDHYRNTDIISGSGITNIGFDESFAQKIDPVTGASVVVDHLVDITVGSSLPENVYITSSGAGNPTLNYGMYTVPTSGHGVNTLKLPPTQARNLSFTTYTAAPQLVGDSIIGLAGTSFQSERFLDWVGSSVIFNTGAAVAGDTTYVVTQITHGGVPGASSSIEVDPPLVTALPAQSEILIAAPSVRVDNNEIRIPYNRMFSLSPASDVNAHIYSQSKTSDASTADTHLRCTNLDPISTAIVGSVITVTDLGSVQPANAGQRCVITRIGSSGPTALDLIHVSPPLPAVPLADLTFNIVPPDLVHVDDKFGIGIVGGVYTSLNFFPFPVFPQADTKFPGERTYGIVEEYVEYTQRNGDILTLSDPHYFKYDHPGGTKITPGSGVFKTAVYGGSDYRPYLFGGGYLGVLFGTNKEFNKLFTAAGVDVKGEETDLGP